MKILDLEKTEHVITGGESRWYTWGQVLTAGREDTIRHQFGFHPICIPFRIAEYGMDPNDIDAVLHLLLHEHLLFVHKEKTVTCYTPGYAPKEALAWQLARIDEQIRAQEARMTDVHRRMVKHPPHKHPVLDPVREAGVRSDHLDFCKEHVARTTRKLAKASR
jgi:hypothetical protein